MADRTKESSPQYEMTRWEMIDGVVYDMSPPPSTPHQRVSGSLYALFYVYLQGKSCQVFHAPFGVWFRVEDEDEHVEPDITLVCDPGKLQHRGCVGVPDLIVEILSPSTSAKDRRIKLRKYEREGVREFWIVDPLTEYVEVYQLGADDKYAEPDVYENTATLQVGIFPDLAIDLKQVFTTP